MIFERREVSKIDCMQMINTDRRMQIGIILLLGLVLIGIYGSNINGNIKANELNAKDAFIEGKIDCTEGVDVRENTVVLGDISAKNLMVDGAIQGKLDIQGTVTLGDKAIVDSDIKAKSIQVSNGAAINGYCSLCYADVTPKNFFPETEPAKPAKPAGTKSTEKTRKSAAS